MREAADSEARPCDALNREESAALVNSQAAAMATAADWTTREESRIK